MDDAFVQALGQVLVRVIPLGFLLGWAMAKFG